jgi:hypothetical protein
MLYVNATAKTVKRNVFIITGAIQFRNRSQRRCYKNKAEIVSAATSFSVFSFSISFFFYLFSPELSEISNDNSD